MTQSPFLYSPNPKHEVKQVSKGRVIAPTAPTLITQEKVVEAAALETSLLDAINARTTAQGCRIKFDIMREEAEALVAVGAQERHVRPVLSVLDQLRTVFRAYEAGFEPTTPPALWFCGQPPQWENETNTAWATTEKFFPGKRPKEYQTVLRFQGHVPASVYPMWKTAVGIFGPTMIRIYAPSQEAFDRVYVDPVMVGAVNVDGEVHFFEIGRWGTREDMAIWRELVEEEARLKTA